MEHCGVAYRQSLITAIQKTNEPEKLASLNRLLVRGPSICWSMKI